MADESMAIDQEVNGEEADDTRVNGVELQDTSEEAVTLNAKDIGNIPLPGESVGESEESEDQVIDSPVRLNLEEDTEDEVMQNVDKLEKEENSTIEDECNDNTNGKEDEETDIPETPVASNSRKRKLSSNEDNDQDLRGFETPAEPSPLIKKRVDKLEKDIREAELESQKWRVTLPPAKRPHLSSPAHNSEIPSRPSSGLSHRSESDLIGGNGSDLSSSAANSPSSVPKNRKSTVDLSSPLYRLPMEQGWKRELVYRATLDQYQRRQGDIYYYTPQGKKLRSNREVSEHLSGTGLTIEHFTFFKEPLGIDDPDKEIIRDAKLMRTRTESPVNVPEKSTPVIKEGKRTPKPKGPKGTSPERGVVNSPKLSAPFKVKSFGSRLSNTNLGTPAKGPVKETAKPAPAKKTPVQWKKNTRAAVVESQSPPPGDKKKPKPAVTPKPPTPKPAATPKTPKGGKAGENGTPTGKKGRGKAAAAEEKKESAKPNQEASLKALMQCGMFVNVFGYLNKRELAAAARVCRAWRDIAYTRSLWRSVRMKNSQVTDWQGLAATLKRQGTRHLDLRKMLLPPDDTDHIWDQFTKHIASVDSLLRIELCRCPASVVERVCKGLPQLQALIATSIRCAKLDPAPLGRLTNLTELRIKGMNGLNLSSDLKCLEHLTKLKHLSITSIREFEKQQCECIGQLSQLECLELGECTLSGEQGAQLLAPLKRLTRLRLERSPSEGAHLMLHAAAKLPLLTHLELINFEIKAGVEDALAACTNVRRLLIIPMYVSQSATTNWCVLDGVLRLRSTLTHLVWGVTIELLRVTELFIDQCDRPTEGAARPVKPVRKAGMGDCIPVLKPVPGMCAEVAGNAGNGGPARVEILPLPALQRLLTTELPDTRLKILRIPFHATWRQALSDLD